MNMICSLQNLFSPRIPNKTALKFNPHSHSTAPTLFRPSAVMVDGYSSNERDDRPPAATFKPSIWGDVFSAFSLDNQMQQNYIEEIEALKKTIRRKLMAAKSTDLMILVDEIERLGLAFHFETEIEDKLKQVYDSLEGEQDYDLFTTALRFRLLRQHQYHVSCDVFTKFVDEDNELRETNYRDTEGLLSLFEASHVRIHDENILEDSVAYTRHLLSNMLPKLDPPMKKKVQLALDYPLHKSNTILTLRPYISIYENCGSYDEDLLRLAKFNFNFLQNIYKNELSEITTWWNMFDVNLGLMHSRKRLVECYISALTFHFEPQYSSNRKMITKLYVAIVIMDDAYDNYATLEEIQLLTQALERWKKADADLLPDYIKKIYNFVMSVSEEFEREAEKQDKSFAIPYYIDQMKEVGRAFDREQQWMKKQQKIPNFENYLKNSQISWLVSYTASTIGIKSATKETLDWLLTDPRILTSSADISRLIQDIASHQRESIEQKVLTGMNCYMKDKGASKEEALSAIGALAEDKWKHLTADLVNCRSLPKEMVVQFLDMVRIFEMFYKNNEDGFTDPEKNIAPLILALMKDPIPI